MILATSAVDGSSIFTSGSGYTFKFTATNSYGRSDFDTISVSAGRAPWGGNFTVTPTNGTTMITPFKMTTKDWKDDATSLPLKYSFGYTASEYGTRRILRAVKLFANATTEAMPLGDSTNEYKLTVDVRAIDQIGAYSSIERTITVISPPTNQRNSVASNTISNIDTTSAKAEDVVEVASTLSSAATLLNSVFDDSATATDASLAEAEALREDLIETMSSFIEVVADSEAVESSVAVLETAVSTSPESMSSALQTTILDSVESLVDSATSIGEVSESAASSSISCVSSLIEGGLFSAPSPTAQPNRSPSRRRLSATATPTTPTPTANKVDDVLLTLNGAIGLGMFPGEESEHASTNLGMKSSVIDASLLGLNDAGLSIGAGLASDNDLPDSVTPAMILPPTLNLSAGKVTVAAINYGKKNPYETDGGVVAEGSSVNSFTLNGMTVKDLTDPIVLELPLPSSTRRRLSEWTGKWPTKDKAEFYSVNCYGRNVSKLEAAYSEEDLARARYCGLESDLINKTRWVNYFQPWVNNSRKVWCNSTETWHYMDCEGRVGVINYTCSVMKPVSACLYWDTTSLSWRSEGCTYWRTDTVKGVAYCNCTHLTSFRSEEAEEAQSSVSSFAETAASVQDLTGSAVRKNMGVIIVLMSLWLGASCLYAYDLMGKDLDEAREKFSDTYFDRYKLLIERMFTPINSGRRLQGNAVERLLEFRDEMREVEIPVDGMLYYADAPTGHVNSKEGHTIDEKSKLFADRLQDRLAWLKNFIGVVKYVQEKNLKLVYHNHFDSDCAALSGVLCVLFVFIAW